MEVQTYLLQNRNLFIYYCGNSFCIGSANESDEIMSHNKGIATMLWPMASPAPMVTVIAHIKLKYLVLISSLFLSTTVYGQESCEQLISKITIQADSVQTKNTFIEKHRKIGKIENSESKFEIRYYYTPSLVNGGEVTVINCVDGRMVAKKIDYWFNPNKSYEKRKINKIRITELEPSESWEAFIDSLLIMDFFEFPTMEEVRPRMKKYMKLSNGRTVEKRSMITDGANYIYQIKIDDKIRTFSYHSPMAWYRVYDHVEELRIADDIKNHFVSNLTEK